MNQKVIILLCVTFAWLSGFTMAKANIITEVFLRSNQPTTEGEQ